MRTFRHTCKKILTASLFTLMFAGFSPAFAETNAAQDHEAHRAHKSMDWPGIYNGFTPCDDCAGIKTSLALNQNHSYILITQFIGKSPREYVEKGKYTSGDKDNIIVLTPRKSTSSHYYMVGENTLTQLDDKGNLISGKQADSYILRRIDVTAEPMSHSSH